MNVTTSTTTPTTFSQWAATQFRAIASRLDGCNIAPPTRAQLAREQLHAAQIALLDAEAEVERATHTAAMLSARVARLSKVQ